MGLRNSSLAKKHDDTLTWVLHKRDPSQQESSQRSHETENANILIRKSYGSSTSSEFLQGRRTYTNHVQRKRRNHVHSNILDYGKPEPTYGYGITDLDDFLSKASIGRPGNIPMVLCTGCLLYQTQLDDHYQTEVALPLGMVVNAVFKNEQWLYAQTPHGEEGYIPYGSCLPLGIVPPPDAAHAPCWETQSDVFPRPVGDRRRLGHHRHHRHRHPDGHRGRTSATRSSSVDGGGGGGGGGDDDDDDDDDRDDQQRHDVAALLFRSDQCAPPPDEHDGGRRQWSWTDGRAKTAARSITGYGYL